MSHSIDDVTREDLVNLAFVLKSADDISAEQAVDVWAESHKLDKKMARGLKQEILSLRKEIIAGTYYESHDEIRKKIGGRYDNV